MVIYDAGKNFVSTEFKQLANIMAIVTKEMPVEAHNSVRLVERYHIPLRQVYEIIQDKLKDKKINKEMILQMAVKAVNNIAGPNRIVPILLVFGVYLQLTDMDPLSLLITKRAEAVRVVMKEVRCLYTERQVKDTLAIYNSPDTKLTLGLLLQSEVQIWHEKGRWAGLYKLIVTNSEIYTINML
jgi:hypothetical protein